MQVRETLRNLVTSMRSRRLISEAIRKPIKQTRPITAGMRVYFHTGGGKKVKAVGWRGPALVVQVNGRQSVLQFSGRFYQRSIDTLRPWYPPHGGVEAAAAAAKRTEQPTALRSALEQQLAEDADARADYQHTEKPQRLESAHSESARAAGSSRLPPSALLRSTLQVLCAGRSLTPDMIRTFERHYGGSFLRAKLATEPKRFQGLRNVAFWPPRRASHRPLRRRWRRLVVSHRQRSAVQCMD